MKPLTVRSVACSLVLLCSGMPAHANLVTNGDFQTGDLSGWVASGTVGVYGTNTAVFNGGDGPPDGRLSQTLSTVDGQDYLLEFDYGVLTFAPPATQLFTVEVLGSEDCSPLAVDRLVDHALAGPTTLEHYVFGFKADGSVVIRFSDDSGNVTTSTDGILDNVRVVAVPADAVTNGDFETGDLSGWEASGTVGVYGTNTAVFNGGDGPPGGLLSQAIPTVDGQEYLVEFDYGVLTYWPATQSLTAQVDGESGPLAIVTVTDPSPSGPATLEHYILGFRANGPSVELIFWDVDTNFTTSTDGILDNIRVVPKPANPVINGDFQTGDLSGWTASGTVGVYGTNTAVFNGGDGPPDGVLSQTLATIVGETYVVSFDYGVFTGWPSTQSLSVSVVGGLATLAVATVTDGSPSAPVTFDHYTLTFTANGPSVILRLWDVNTNFTTSTDGILDNVVVARAPGMINLAWSDCHGPSDQTYACNENTGWNELITSFIAPENMDHVNGFNAIIRVTFGGSRIPDWWQLANGCRDNGISVDFAGIYTCENPWGTLLDYDYEIGAIASNALEIFVYGHFSSAPIDPGIEYYGYTVRLHHSNSTGPGSCSGCDVPACIELRSLTLFGSNAAVITAPLRNTVVTWQGGSSASGVGEPPASLELAAPWPNPSSGAANLEFMLPSASQVHVDVFDVAGRRVSSPIDGLRLPAGKHRVVWDGQDTAGRKVAAGVYEVRVSADGDVDHVRKIVVIR